MDYDANFERDSFNYGGNGTYYNCEIESLESEIEILAGDVECMMAIMGVEPNDEINTCKDLYEYAAIALGNTFDTESIVINGAPATVCFSRDLTFCTIIQYSDNYFYYMEFANIVRLLHLRTLLKSQRVQGKVRHLISLIVQ